MSDVTRLLQSIQTGDPNAASELLPLVYDELRRLAARKMRSERPDHTLQPTALVHEAYLRLVGCADSPAWEGQGHFFAAAAEAMRRILIESARRRDPVLSTAGYRQHEGLVDDLAGTSLEQLADAVVDAGVTRITGSVLGDERRYDNERYVDAWPDRFIDQNQTGPLSALTVNQGFERYPSEADPGAPLVPAADPPTFAAGALTNLLVQRGVEVGGFPGAGDSPPGATEVAAVASPPLEVIVEHMLATSDNTTAELLTKELGVLVGQEGSTSAGTDAIATVLGEQMLPLDGVDVVDGSGLAPTNRTTCLLLSELLDDAGPDSELADGLAVAGESGTLATFLDGTDLEGRLRAKTGSLNDVRSLAGFVEDLEGDTISFAFVINQSEVVTPESDALRDELGVILGTYPETPDLAAIGPLPVDG